MAQTIKLKRSATAGNSPTTSQLSLGEIAINTTDGKLFIKRSVSGTESIVEVGGLPLSGGSLTGNLNLGDNVKAQFGAGNDLEIFHDGSHSRLVDSGTGNFIIQAGQFRVNTANDAEAMIKADIDGAVSLYNSGDLKLATTSTGIDVTGSIVATGDLQLGNDSVASNINAVGDVFVVNVDSNNNTGGTPNIQFKTSGNEKLRVNPTGIDVTGSVTADGLTVDGVGSFSSSAPYIDLFETDTTDLNSRIVSNSSSLRLQTVADNGSNASNRLLIDHSTGDISFYNDSAAQGLFWDSSASSLGIGTTVPARPLTVNGLAGFRNSTTGFGTNDGFDIGVGGSDAYIVQRENANIIIETNGAERLRIKGDGSSVFSGAVTAGGHIITNTSSRIENQRISMEADGTLDWGSSKQYGTLTWDTNKAIIVGQQSSSLEFRTNLSGVAMTMDTSQNVNIPNGKLGIGLTSVPSAALHTSGNVAAGKFESTSSTYVDIDNGTVTGRLQTISSVFNIGTATAGTSLALKSGNGVEAMRLLSDGSCRWTPDGTNHDMTLTADGNLLVGKTASSFTTAGAEVQPSGRIELTRSGELMNLNRLGSDGILIRFFGSSALVGSIGSASGQLGIDSQGTRLNLQLGGTTKAYVRSSSLNPSGDGTFDLGESSERFKDLYLSNNATAQKLTLTKDPVGTYSIEVDGTNTGQPNLIVKQSTSERLRIDNLGRVGIGTSSPIRVLDIATTTGGTIIHLTDDATGHTATDGVDIQQEGTLFQILNREAGDIRFGTDNATRMTITSAGNVGIGTSSPTSYADTTLHVSGSTGSTLKLSSDAQGNANTDGFDISHSGVTAFINNRENGDMQFRTNNVEAMRIDSSGNLLVGTTDSTPYNNNAGSTADNGIVLSEAGWLAAARYQGTVAFLNRTDNDGDIAVFRRDGTTVGSIGSLSGTQIVIDSGGNRSGVRFEDNGLLPRKNSAMADGTVTLGNPSYKFSDLYLSGTANVQYAGATDTGIYFNGSFNAVVPYRPDTGVAVDDYLDLGVYSHRWDDIFATNGTIQTSDRNEKQDIEDLTEAEERVAVAAKGLLKKFRWKSAVEDKGDDARIHFGIIAQDLQDAFEAEGLDAGRYGMFTSNTWTNEDGEEQTRMGVRYSELLAFIISAI